MAATLANSTWGLSDMSDPLSAPPYELVPATSLSYPFYHVARNRLVPSMADANLSMLVIFVVYWVVSLAFHLLDISSISYFEKYRIHEPEEVKRKNRVSRTNVVIAVLVQQALQTALGIAWFNEEEDIMAIDHRKALLVYGEWISRIAFAALGPKLGSSLLRSCGAELTSWMYWWGVPILQFFWASFLLDTWQYGWHRYFHTNKFLYRHIHSWHHRLYCPYAYGALYNHPAEGFVLDSLGTVFAHAGSFMTTRQAILLFSITTWKTCDDHCGFALPWDPAQFLFRNNVAYHDIHHQQFGIKKNFSQPYFTHWDVILNTRMTPEQVPMKNRLRYKAGPCALVQTKDGEILATPPVVTVSAEKVAAGKQE